MKGSNTSSKIKQATAVKNTRTKEDVGATGAAAGFARALRLLLPTVEWLSPEPGIPTVTRVLPCPLVIRAPRTPKEVLTPLLLKFSVTPGRMRRRF